MARKLDISIKQHAMKNKENHPNEELEDVKNEGGQDALSKDQNEKENREDLEKVNNGIEVDEIDRPDG